MIYKKPKAEVLVFDNSDVITASICGKPSTNCGKKTSGNSCNNNLVEKFDNCKNLNHKACGELGMNNDSDASEVS